MCEAFGTLHFLWKCFFKFETRYQFFLSKISEEERKILIETLDKQKIAFKKQRNIKYFRRNYRFRNIRLDLLLERM